MKAQLVLVEGGKTVVVQLRLPTVVGRSTAADLKVPDSQVSRRHCELFDYEDQIAVRDLDSVNGTIVNGERIQQDTLLTTGDHLTIGNVTFRVDVEGVPSDNSPAAGDSGVITMEPEASGSTVHSESAVIQYQATDEGSMLNVMEQAIEAGEAEAEPPSENDDDDDDDESLRDFLKDLGH